MSQMIVAETCSTPTAKETFINAARFRHHKQRYVSVSPEVQPEVGKKWPARPIAAPAAKLFADDCRLSTADCFYG
jgi:hypothetical protein